MANETQADPFAAWRDWMNQSERQWNSFLNEAMATEEFSRTMGRGMDVFLNMQKQMNEAFGRMFTSLNMPSRTDIMGLADRLSAIEERLISLEATLSASGVTSANGTGEAAAIPAKPGMGRPPRTRQPHTS